ncbi:MAG: hypothetical protein HRU33_21205 [Rhodobacteraceae bacterium]|nr:hypothetical protein [Paracoccaceae bacterium]
MEERCPGLPDYRALFECAEAFTSADTYPKGRLIAYPADWGVRSKELVTQIDLPFEAVAGGSEGAMIAELKGSIATKEPMLMMMWQPHWLFSEVDVNFVEWNVAEGGCVEGDQAKTTACGFEQAEIVKVV